MGVQGLLTVCLERKDECTESVDLVEIARQKDGIELVVDFNCFKRHLVSRFWTGLSDACGNPYIKILGGEYSSIERYVTKLIEDLKSLGIQLVFFTVGAKGSSTEALLRKKDTWIRRDMQEKENIRKLLDACRGQGNIQELDDESSLLPLLLEDQFMAAARKCECEFNQNPAGEVDMLAIRALRERPKAYAILSNDSDFCIYPGSRFIPIQLFDIKNDLQLGKPIELPKKPLRLEVKVITTEKIMSMFQVRSRIELIEMTIVSGNDYTKEFMRGRHGYHQNIGFQGRVKLENFARWISKYGNVEGHQFLSKKMRDNEKFRNAVEYSRNRYSLQSEPDAPPQKGNITQVVAKGITDGKYPNIFMSIHNNYYWFKLLLEDIPRGQPCTERSLIPLRRYIYRIVLPREENQVEEYGRSLSGNMQNEYVKAAEDPTSIVPSIDEIKEEDVAQNLRHFHAIMSHQERDKDTDQDKGYWFDHYKMKDGFIVYLLRYFLLLNWKRKPLNLSKEEYLALAAMVLGEKKEAEYQRLRVIPSVECVTIGNWFQPDGVYYTVILSLNLHCHHNTRPLEDQLLFMFTLSKISSGFYSLELIAFQNTVAEVKFSVADRVVFLSVTEENTVRYKNLYRHVSMLASALSIKSEFPLPSEIFSGSRWTAMYMVSTHQAVRSANEQVKVEMDAIIEGKRDMIHHIVEGVFTLDDQ